MKAVLGWLSDPYVHVLAVGLVLVRLAMGAGGDDPPEAALAGQSHCPACLRQHTEPRCLPLVVDTARRSADH